MKPKEFKSRIENHDITRRGALKVLSSVGLTVVAQPMLSSPVFAASDPGKLVSFTWAGYDKEEIHGSYKSKHGTSPEFSFFSSYGEALPKLQAGFPADLVHPCANVSRRWKDSGLFKPLDTSRMEHWPDVLPQLKTIEGIALEGKTWIAPFDMGNTSICYNSEVYGDNYDESWKMIIDSGHSGRLATNDGTDNFVAVALAIGIQPYTMTEADLPKVKAALLEQKKHLRFYWDSQTEMVQAMVGGEIDAAVCYNDGMAKLKKEGFPVKFANPKEGIVTWVCGVAHGANGPSDDALVYDFINAMQAPESGAWLIDNYGYGHSNSKAYGMVPPERLAELGFSNVAEFLAGGIFAVEGPAGMRDHWNKILEEVRLGI